MKKYMILCVAGQSNAVGYDESKIPADYMARFDTGRIFQLGLYGGDNLKVIPWAPVPRISRICDPSGIRRIPASAPGASICPWSTGC